MSTIRSPRAKAAKSTRIYAIGDVHGRIDLLRALLEKIVNHLAQAEIDFENLKLIFLGDLIDRGPNSKEVLALVEKLIRLAGAILIRGNHENLLIRSIDGDIEAQAIWLENGGTSCLRSFGVSPPRPDEDSFDFGDRIAQALSERELSILRSAPVFLRSGDYYFVHAGVRPGVRLSRQAEFDLFFIREEFTSSRKWHGAMIVHGHTIVEDVQTLPNRIAIDTGAYKSGRLSAVCIQDDWIEIITT